MWTRWLRKNVQLCVVLLCIAIVTLFSHGIHGQQHHSTVTPVLQAAHQQHQQNKEQQHFQQMHQQQLRPTVQPHSQQQQQQQVYQPQQQQSQMLQHHGGGSVHGSGGHMMHDSRSPYKMLSQAMSEAVSHEFSGTGSGGSAPDGSCLADDMDCLSNIHDRLGMEAIRSLHQQLDDDDNGNIDLTESDDFLREELKYDSGYEKRHKTFHYNDDTQISVKELWEAWLRSEVHNWTMEQTTDWLAQSVQLPQYVELFQKHKVSGATLPRLAVHNMHYVSTVLGIRDPIHKQKIALKAMDVVLFGPPRETGNRWKDYFLVTLLLSAIIGCWYAYQQNKNAKRHLRRMAKDMEGLQRAENALTEMQKELELARLEQENVATEKLDLERRLKEAPSLSSSSSDLELQQLKQEVEMLRAELSRAEVELVDHCWTPPQALQSWLQLTYELESKHTLKKRVCAEKQLQLAREACEKLKKKRTSLVGAFVSTHGKSIDDVDRSIVEARNALSEVTNELQERLHRWKQIESMLGLSIVNNNGLAYLESVLYNRNGSGKSSRNRISGSQDELDDESSVQEFHGSHGTRLYREDSSGSDDGDTVTFIVGSELGSTNAHNFGRGLSNNYPSLSSITSAAQLSYGQQPQPSVGSGVGVHHPSTVVSDNSPHSAIDEARSLDRIMPLPRTKKTLVSAAQTPPTAVTQPQTITNHIGAPNQTNHLVNSGSHSATPPPAGSVVTPAANITPASGGSTVNRAPSGAPLPPPRRANSHQSLNRTQSTDLESLESQSTSAHPSCPITPQTIVGGNHNTPAPQQQQQQQQPPQHHQQQLNHRSSFGSVQPVSYTATSPPSGGGAIANSSATVVQPATSALSLGSHSVDDTYSTDSSSFDGGVDLKKRRRKLHFPFGKKKNSSAK